MARRKIIEKGDNFNLTHLRAREKLYLTICQSSNAQLKKFERLAVLDGHINAKEEKMLDIERKGLELKKKQLAEVRDKIKEIECKKQEKKCEVADKLWQEAHPDKEVFKAETLIDTGVPDEFSKED